MSIYCLSPVIIILLRPNLKNTVSIDTYRYNGIQYFSCYLVFITRYVQ